MISQNGKEVTVLTAIRKNLMILTKIITKFTWIFIDSYSASSGTSDILLHFMLYIIGIDFDALYILFYQTSFLH